MQELLPSTWLMYWYDNNITTVVSSSL